MTVPCTDRQELLFPEDAGTVYGNKQRQAVEELCSVCAVRAWCEDRRRRNNDKKGVWGGRTEADRANGPSPTCQCGAAKDPLMPERKCYKCGTA